MSGLTSTRNFRLLLFHHSRCTTHNGRVKSVKSATVTCLCALVNNIVYNIKKKYEKCNALPRTLCFWSFFLLIFITIIIIIIISRFGKRIMYIFLNRIELFSSNDDKSAKNGLCTSSSVVYNTRDRILTPD